MPFFIFTVESTKTTIVKRVTWNPTVPTPNPALGLAPVPSPPPDSDLVQYMHPNPGPGLAPTDMLFKRRDLRNRVAAKRAQKVINRCLAKTEKKKGYDPSGVIKKRRKQFYSFFGHHISLFDNHKQGPQSQCLSPLDCLS